MTLAVSFNASIFVEGTPGSIAYKRDSLLGSLGKIMTAGLEKGKNSHKNKDKIMGRIYS